MARKPVIGLLATGSELLDVNDSLQPGKIRNSNTYMILSQIRRAGGRVKYFGKFSDDFHTCFKAVKRSAWPSRYAHYNRRCISRGLRLFTSYI